MEHIVADRKDCMRLVGKIAVSKAWRKECAYHFVEVREVSVLGLWNFHRAMVMPEVG